MNGEWSLSAKSKSIPDPLNGEPFIKLPDTQLDEIEPFVQSLRAVPKSGLHNPLKNPERCANSKKTCSMHNLPFDAESKSIYSPLL